MNFNQKYEHKDFLTFLRDFLPLDFIENEKTINIDPVRYKKIIQAKIIGTCESLDLTIFEMDHKEENDPRVTIATDAFRILADHWIHKALVIFKNKNSKNYRFSYLTISLDINEKNKVTKQYSNARRYSFYLGENSKTNTPYKFLISKGRIKNIEDLESRFSVEVVNKEFYSEISDYFIQLIGGTFGTGRSKKEYKPVLKLPSINERSRIVTEFAVRLIGRIIFCWFLREKKSDNHISLIPKELLSSMAVDQNNNYYHTALEPIFFEILNKPLESRLNPYQKEPYSLIPYLNGGLFSAHDDDFYQLNSIGTSSFINTLKIPDQWFKNFFTMLETYHFTIDENISFDEDLSIDPEMLGRIFENLLAEINPETEQSARKSTGSYYTPRQIVNYMVDESLFYYIKDKTNIEEDKLRGIISYDLNDDKYFPLNDDEKHKVAEALEKLKLLDPACGSGAFPIGALQKIVFILQQIDPNGQIWFKKQVQSTSPEIRKIIEREFAYKNFNYIRKLGVIRENIYGVDIQPIATEISRLRCFLTLIVDERIQDDEQNRGIEPLPNLDFKFVTANSLIKLDFKKNSNQDLNQIGLYEDLAGISELKDLRDQFFTATEKQRIELKQKFVEVQNKLLRKIIEQRKAEIGDATHKLTMWNPFGHESTSWFDSEWMFGIKDGFDIIITNPPYGAEFSDPEKIILKSKYGHIVERIPNSFLYFMGLGYDLVNHNGIVSMIEPNEFLFQIYMTKARRFFVGNTKILHAINVGEDVFDAIVPTCIISFKKTKEDVYDIPVSDFRKNSLHELQKNLNTNSFSRISNEVILNSPNSIFIFDLKFNSLINKLISKGISFENYCDDIANGVSTSCDQVYILSREFADSIELETEYLKPCIRGGQFNRFYCPEDTNDVLLYITDIFDWNAAQNISKYLLENKTLLIKKSVEKKAGKRDWKILFRSRYEGLFVSPKILIRQTADKVVAAIDLDKGYYCIDSVNVALLKQSEISNIKFFLGILNSSVINFYYREIAQEGGRVLAQVKPQRIKSLPIPIASEEQRTAIELLVEQIIRGKKNDELLRANVLECELNKLVYELFELTKDEISIVESSV